MGRLAILALAVAVAAGAARAGETIVLRSGQVAGAPGSPGQLDDSITCTFNTVCNTPLSASAFTPADFAAAQGGSQAVICFPLPPWAWPPSIACDADARWINWGDIGPHPTTAPGSALYAVDFTVTTVAAVTATVQLCYRIDDQLGDLGAPNPDGVFVNGVPVSGLFVGDGTPYSVASVPVHTGVNTLYLYQRDSGCSDAGIMFSAAIIVDDPISVGTPFCTCESGAPCGNTFAGAGCRNSTTFGAHLVGYGSSSVLADDLVLHTSALPLNGVGIYFMSQTSIAPVFFGDGLRCIGGQTARFPGMSSGASGTVNLGPGLVDYSQTHFPSPLWITSGSTWHFQYWYRDIGGPCNQNFNISNGLTVDFTP